MCGALGLVHVFSVMLNKIVFKHDGCIGRQYQLTNYHGGDADYELCPLGDQFNDFRIKINSVSGIDWSLKLRHQTDKDCPASWEIHTERARFHRGLRHRAEWVA